MARSEDLVAQVLPSVLLPFHGMHLFQVGAILLSAQFRPVEKRTIVGFAFLVVWFVAALVESIRHRRMTTRIAVLALFTTPAFIVCVLPTLSPEAWRTHGTWLGIACADCVVGFVMLQSRKWTVVALGLVALPGIYALCVVQIDGARTLLTSTFLVTASNFPAVSFVAAGLASIVRNATDARSSAESELAVARERNRLHRVIHDAALQPLEALGGEWDVDIEAVRANARQQAVLLRTAIRGETSLDDLVLSDRLRALASQWIAKGLRVDLDLRADDALVSPVLVDAMVGSANEALMNVSKHAGIGRACISSWVRADRVHVRVRDDGRGFDSTIATMGLGLSISIRERMREVRGGAEIESIPGSGTTVSMWIPC